MSLLETRPEVSTHKENRRVFLRAQSKWHRVRAQLADEFKSVSALDLERAVFSTRPGSDAAADRARGAAAVAAAAAANASVPASRLDFDAARGARERAPTAAAAADLLWGARTDGAKSGNGADVRRSLDDPDVWRAPSRPGPSPRGRDGGTRSASGTPVVAAAGAEAPAARRRARGATAAIRNTRIAKPPGT